LNKNMRKRTIFKIGQKYNRLTIIEKMGYDKHNNRLYKCRCDCGNEIIVRGNALTSGNTKSCGCYKHEIDKSRRFPNNSGVAYQVMLGYKRHAKDRGLIWELTREECQNLIEQPCHYCGRIKTNLKITKNCKEGYRYNGIDRVDNTKGYVKNNVVSCCNICNRAKRDLTKEEFLEWIKTITTFNYSKQE